MALTKATNRMIKGAQVNIKDFESLSSGGTDWQPAIQAAIDSLDTGSDYTTGGVIYFPVGRYYIKKPIIVRTTGEGVEKLTSITLQGEGMHNTIIDCADGFTGEQAVYAQDPTYCAFKDFQIMCWSRANTGLEIKRGNEITVERVFCQRAVINDFRIWECFMLTMNQCRAKGGATGFNFSDGFNTSLNIVNCYAVDSETTSSIGQGFLIRDVSYSTFTACGADFTGRYGYRISNTAGVTFLNCGNEQSKRSAFVFEASAALDGPSTIKGTRCVLDGCFSTGADSDNGYGSIYSNNDASNPSTVGIDVEINRFYEHNVDNAYSVASGGVSNSKISLNSCRFIGAIISSAAVIDPINVTSVNKAVTSANTPVVDLASVFGNSLNYSGILHIVASNASPASTSAANTSAYVLLVTKYTIGVNSYAINVTEIAKNGLTTGGNANHPSFTWAGDVANNQLEATPIGSTSGNFYFYIGQLGALSAIEI